MAETDDTDQIDSDRPAPNLASGLGVFDGLYEAGYLEKLRSEERA